MHQQIKRNQVPSAWTEVGYFSLKPLGAWLKDLNHRVQFFDNWLKHGHQVSFDMSAFF